MKTPVVAFGGGFQPATVRSCYDGHEDGWSDRELTAWPDADATPWNDVGLSDELVEAYHGKFAEIAKLRRYRQNPLVATMTPEAQARYVWWYNNTRQATNTAPRGLRGIYAKMPRQCGRIAIILHVMTHPSDPTVPVSLRTIENAIDLTEYFCNHARRIIAYLGGQTEERYVGSTSRVLRRLEDRGEWMTLTDIHRLFNNNLNGNVLNRDLDTLTAEGKLERKASMVGNKFIDHWRATNLQNASGTNERIRTNSDEFLSPSEPNRPIVPTEDTEYEEGESGVAA